MKFSNQCHNERGAVLVIGLIFMAILSILGTSAYLTSSNELKISANYKTGNQALYYAEAGIQEALGRMNLAYDDTYYIGEPPDTAGWPNATWGRHIVLTGASGGIYTDVTTLQTQDGTELNYLVTIDYKIEDATFNNGVDNDEVVLYGQDWGYPAPAPITGKLPIKVVTSTGYAENNSQRTITIETTTISIVMGAKAAVACDNSPLFDGATYISGFNHDLTTNDCVNPAHNTFTNDITSVDLPFDNNTVDNHGGDEKHGLPPPPYSNVNDTDITFPLQPGEEVTTVSTYNEVQIPWGNKIENDQSTHLPGIWSTGDPVNNINCVYGGNSNTLDRPNNSWKDEDGANIWLDLHDLLGITLAELQLILDSANVNYPEDTTTSGGNVTLNVDPVGVTYMDIPAGKCVKFSAHTNGRGLMYVDGDLDANNLSFKGLIFVEGTIKLAGGFFLLGSIAVKGGNPTGTGGGHLLYSKDTLDYFAADSVKHTILLWQDESLTP